MKIPVFSRCVEQLICEDLSGKKREYQMLNDEIGVVLSFLVYRLICLLYV